jgi:hypothetical protein
MLPYRVYSAVKLLVAPRHVGARPHVNAIMDATAAPEIDSTDAASAAVPAATVADVDATKASENAAVDAAAAAVAAATVADISDAAEPLSKASCGASSSASPGDADQSMSKTEFSQSNAGRNSYYYWHGDAERRRVTGETPVPLPEPKKLALIEVAKEKRVKAIEAFTFMDDDNAVKVYIALEGSARRDRTRTPATMAMALRARLCVPAGPLASVSSSDVDAEFFERSLLVCVNTPDVLFKFHVDRLTHSVDALRCKASVTKSRKLLLKLHKKSHMERWQKLRAI